MSDFEPTIRWDRPMLERFKKAYEEARADHSVNTFMFDGNEFLVAYSKYLIEYLESILQ